MPFPSSVLRKPFKALEILFLTVCISLGTEIPYPSSQTATINGTFITAAAFIVSQNTPSDVELSPIVQNDISFPFFEKLPPGSVSDNSLYFLEARAIPSDLAIWPAVQLMSEETFFKLL